MKMLRNLLSGQETTQSASPKPMSANPPGVKEFLIDRHGHFSNKG